MKTINSFWLLIVFVLYPHHLLAQNIQLISDEETEQLLNKLIYPIYDAAGVSYNRNEIHIVDDNNLNAFVADGNNLFINTGTILGASSENELVGVIAHETGHIKGGHILRQKLKNKEIQEVGLASIILAGTAGAITGRGDVAMAAILGGQSSSITNYLEYRTSEERAADETALSLLKKMGQSSKGILEFMKKIAKQNNLSGQEENPYFRTHPITSERIAFFEQAVANEKNVYHNKHQEEFIRVQAKLYAYLMPAEKTLQKYPYSNTSTPALYAQAIALFKQLKFKKADIFIDKLIKREPSNPFFYELKAQIYLETGKISLAKKNYAKALALFPKSALLQTSYAQSILEDNPSRQQAKQAAKLLNKALISRPNSFSWLLLARAYAITGNMAGANYAAAEYSYRTGDFKTSQKQLASAKEGTTSPQLALKIDDLNNRIKQILHKK